jgi:undecaprenyl diphosphate synthase
MDGNGRWAVRRGLPRSEGHRAGAAAVRRVVTAAREIGLGHLTLYTFSRENWSRPVEEVSLLFGLLVDFLGRELDTLQKNDIRLHIFGENAALPLAARKALEHVLTKTRGNGSMHLNLALNYSGREEITRACKQYAAEGGRLEDLTPELLAAHLYSAGQPDPDLIIRTSGEYRTSNFLLFQSAYSEYFFTETLWPDFEAKDLYEALRGYTQRIRRFGNI